jgi:hypothetical protein
MSSYSSPAGSIAAQLTPSTPGAALLARTKSNA